MKKILHNIKNSINGFRLAWRDDQSYRIAVTQVVLGCIIATALALYFDLPMHLWLTLVISLIPIVIIELVNTAIEAVTDKASPERSPLAKKAKDVGSAAVMLTRIMAASCWIIIFATKFFEEMQMEKILP